MGMVTIILLTLPGKLADQLAAEDDRGEVFTILYREVCAALTALSTPESYAQAGIKVAQAYMSKKGSDDV
jgi:hypothetical protein